jgi:predicted cupin superfamily sugar epimerase
MRSVSTSILYLLTAGDPSRFHRLRFDEVWFFHAGSSVEMVLLDPLETQIVGPEKPQVLAPGGRWMAARVVGAEASSSQADIAWALVGCVVSPGFEYDDFEPGHRQDLLQAYPEAVDYIEALAGG